MRRLACCTRDREISPDLDEHERVMTYNGLESCILNSFSYDNESSISRVDGCASDSLDEDGSSCSSSKDAFGSFSSQWLVNKQDEHQHDDLEVSSSLKCFHPKEKPSYTIQLSDVEIMKERFAKLLLGEDVTGGHKGLCTALALSNAITNLGASVFGELWKLEPLPEERKRKWRREMDWLLSPTNYMVELVPAKQNSANGRTLEIMTPKARADIHLNLPALQKLDSMLIDTLDSMVNTEFWYAEGVSRAEGRSMTTRQSKRWWLPSPQVPPAGLSIPERKKLLYQGKVVQQVFKAAKSINEDVLLEIPVPSIIQDALPKSGKANLGEELHQVLTAELSSVEVINSLNLKGEHGALEAVNRLEAAVLAWKQRINEQNSGLSPVRNSWSFMKDPCSELDKMEMLSDRAEALLHMLKTRYPNLPQSFLDVTKVQYNKDVGRSILEAYSRVLGSIAFRIISRIGDILQEDVLMNPESPVATCFPGENLSWIPKSPVVRDCIRYSLIDQMNKTDIISFDSSASKDPDLEFSDNEVGPYPVTAAHFRSRSRIWCIGREACNSVSSTNTP